MSSSDQWLILELNDLMSNVGYREMEGAILQIFGTNVDYFIPIHNEKMGSYVSMSTLMEGYAFVKDTSAARSSLLNMSDQRIFSGVLHQAGKYQTISNKAVSELKRKLKKSLKKKFELGTKVMILEGTFKNLTGEVIGLEEGGKKVILRIKRISREIIAPMPATLVEAVKIKNG